MGVIGNTVARACYFRRFSLSVSGFWLTLHSTVLYICNWRQSIVRLDNILLPLVHQYTDPVLFSDTLTCEEPMFICRAKCESNLLSAFRVLPAITWAV